MVTLIITLTITLVITLIVAKLSLSNIWNTSKSYKFQDNFQYQL